MKTADKALIEVIPSINVRTFTEMQQRIKEIEPYVSWCHLDVTDGVFSRHQTWHDPADLSLLATNLNVEVHLMIQEPEKVLDQWLIKPVKRVIIHQEASSEIGGILDRCRKAGIGCGIAIRPGTSWTTLSPWLQHVDLIQILAVSPGPSGQPMNEEVVDKIAHLRASCPLCIIEIDGGMNPETADRARKAGASIIVSGEYIFSHSDIARAIQELRGE